jgi:phosphate transport system protein
MPYPGPVPREEFHHELDEIEALLQDEGRLCERALEQVMTGLRSHNSDRARAVIAEDDDVDRLYTTVESAIESLLARQTPVAIDLRLVLAMLHINSHLERIGDQCVNIAKLLLLMDEASLAPELVDEFDVMGTQAEAMIREAMDSFGARDVGRAEALVEMDQVINRAHHGLARRIMALNGDAGDAELGLRAIVIGRCLERIGDNAVDIGERTAYLVTAEFREFTDASHPAN